MNNSQTDNQFDLFFTNQINAKPIAEDEWIRFILLKLDNYLTYLLTRYDL